MMKDSKMSTHLSGDRLNVALVQETMRKELLNLLQQCEGPKVSKTFSFNLSPLTTAKLFLNPHKVSEKYHPFAPSLRHCFSCSEYLNNFNRIEEFAPLNQSKDSLIIKDS